MSNSIHEPLNVTAHSKGCCTAVCNNTTSPTPSAMEFASDEDFQAYARSSGHAFVSFTLFQAETKLGTLTLELYTDVAPSTCKHFLELTTGKGPHRYKGTPIHRVVKQAFIQVPWPMHACTACGSATSHLSIDTHVSATCTQGGDVVDGTGKGDPKFTIPDETFSMKHDDRGIVAMANNGTPHSASSQVRLRWQLTGVGSGRRSDSPSA